MARIGINTGSVADDNTGSTLRAAGGIINNNFLEIYNHLGDGTNLNEFTATKVEATVTGIGSTELVRGNMADNDHFRILIGGTASDVGFVEIATADNGDEPIYVRQYTTTGLGTPFGTLNRTLTLLDASGNTTIPGSVGIGTTNPTSKLHVVGVVSATSFSGSGSGLTNIPSGQLTGALPVLDGSALTGIVASGSGIIIKDSGSTVGTAGTIDFGDNLTVSAISAGIVTVTGSAGGVRTTVTATTSSIGAGATSNLNIDGFKTYSLLKVGISSAAWVVLYTDSTSRSNDESRSYLTDPTPGSGVIAEVRTVSSGISTFIMSPGVIGWNNDVSVASTIYARVTNNESSTSTGIGVTLTVVKLED